MFYRLDRIFDWKSSSGLQLENSIITIGSCGLIGNGINEILLYFPDSQYSNEPLYPLTDWQPT